MFFYILLNPAGHRQIGKSTNWQIDKSPNRQISKLFFVFKKKFVPLPKF